MKLFLSEFMHSYKKYLFGYTKHALREENDLLDDLYSAGFLPYTGNTEIKDIYYMARSCRIDLDKFTLSSENKRVQKKISSDEINRTKRSAADYINDENFLDFCLEYFTTKHGMGIFTKDRLQFILSFSSEINVIKYETRENNILGYVIEAEGKGAAQYWFSFYNLNAPIPSLGLWLMLDCIIAAKEKKLLHYYLGTIYGEKALYKTNFKALEYWDGNDWLQNIADLKKLAREDKEREVIF